MHIAAAEITLQLHASSSLKDKRRVLHSVVSKLRRQHSVSAAEVDANDSWDFAKIGIAIVSGDLRIARQLLDRTLEFVERAAPEAEVIAVRTDIWDFHDVGHDFLLEL